MKAFLMYPDRDFDLGQDLPPNEADLAGDLELDIVLRAMADGDPFLFDVARQGLHSGITSLEEIAYRQHVLADCIAQPGRGPRPVRRRRRGGHRGEEDPRLLSRGIRRRRSCTAPGSCWSSTWMRSAS